MPKSLPRSLTSPEVLHALEKHLRSYDSATRARGQRVFAEGRVGEPWTDDDLVAAQVTGSAPEPYTATLQREGPGWHAQCECPVEFACKHTYALGLAWLSQRSERGRGGGGGRAGVRPEDASSRPAAPSAAKPKPAKSSFRDEWTPLLGEKLGRPLTPDEGRLLGRLADLFQELQTQGGLFGSSLRQRGFAVSPDAAPDAWGPAFADWWQPAAPPADPWALWQYLAYDAERSGRPIPECLRPMTDTTQVRAALDARFLRREIEQWRHTLAGLAHPGPGVAGPPVAGQPERFQAPADFRIALRPEGVAEFEVFLSGAKSWKAPTQKWLVQLTRAGLDDLAPLPPAAHALALLIRLGPVIDLRFHARALPAALLARVLAHPPAAAAVVLPDGSPFRIEPEPLRHLAQPDPADPQRLRLILVRPDLTPVTGPLQPFLAAPQLLYLLDGRVWRGPAPLPARLPAAALSDPGIVSALRTQGVALPASVDALVRTISLRPLLRCWVEEPTLEGMPTVFHAQLFAVGDEPRCAQHWVASGWQWTADGAPPAARAGEPLLLPDLAAANAVGAHFGAFRLLFYPRAASWARTVTKSFPEEFVAWHALLPADLVMEVSPELRGLLGDPLRARLAVSVAPAAGSGQDWFDLSVQLQPQDLTLTPEEIALLVKAKGGWVHLPQRGWQRLALDEALAPAAQAALDRLGLAADADALSGRRTTHRYHALQLADAPVDDAVLAARLRARAAELRALPPPPLPEGLHAELRPYQTEGFHFLAHLAAQGLGGILADDMGLGKTLQTLAWLLWLRARAAAEGRPFRALVVCPKSVVPNWATEAARFSPALSTARLTAADQPPPADAAALLVVNYAQLRLRATTLGAIDWEAVVLDEGQNIKNPASSTARIARELRARHRLVLTGTPIENRLLDLWSLLAFAQPGLLGSQAVFQRTYSEKEDAAGARARLATRVRPFLLRRTKSQVARDLPARTEEDIVCELEGPQRALYDAELKRARQLLLGVETARQFDTQRFNILQSLLRLRQICCHPALVGLEAASGGGGGGGAAGVALTAGAGSAKLDALLDTLEPLVAEGHRVLVFSQFVRMLELIRAELITRAIPHLLLTGQTEDRQALVDTFQSPAGPPVFLLSLKAAGAGLNLTAASYVVLFDPWWNPAVEAQAIDRTHRIGQTSPVIAYRLLARDTIEEKIRALQREKAALAAAVVQEESLAVVMDLENLRHILA